jgi:ankyrin repeat protein
VIRMVVGAAAASERHFVMSQEDAPTKPEYVVPTAGKRGMTSLHHAAYLNDPDAVRAELQRGIPVDVRDDGGWTPLHWSIDMAQAWGEPEQVVSLLLQAGASPNSVDDSGFSVLMMACGRNNEAILEQLIKAGADINLRTAETTPLHQAAGCNFSEGIQRLLALGANPQQTDSRGRTPEQLAEVCGFDECEAALKAARPAT